MLYKSNGKVRTVSRLPPLHNASAISPSRIRKVYEMVCACFLNAISSHRPATKIPVMERLAIASIVRIESFNCTLGFVYPVLLSNATISDVGVSNLSIFSLATAGVSAAMVILHYLYQIMVDSPLLSLALYDFICASLSADFLKSTRRANGDGKFRLFEDVKVRIDTGHADTAAFVHNYRNETGND